MNFRHCTALFTSLFLLACLTQTTQEKIGAAALGALVTALYILSQHSCVDEASDQRFSIESNPTVTTLLL